MVVEPFALLVPVRQLQSLFTPQPLDLLVIDAPSFGAQQFTDLAISIAAISFGQPDQGQTQFILISGR